MEHRFNWTKFLVTFALCLTALGGGFMLLQWQLRANKHEIVMKTTPAVLVPVQAPVATPAPQVAKEVLEMATSAAKVAEEKNRPFSFEGGGAKFELGAGCNTCAAAPAPAATPTVTPPPPEKATVAVIDNHRPVYLKKRAPREKSIRRSSRVYTLPQVQQTRGIHPRSSAITQCRHVVDKLTVKKRGRTGYEDRFLYTGPLCQTRQSDSDQWCDHMQGYPSIYGRRVKIN